MKAFKFLLLAGLFALNLPATAQFAPDSVSFMKLKRTHNGGFHYIESDSIYFEFLGEYGQTDLSYCLKDNNHNLIMSDTLPNNMLSPQFQDLGDNRFLIDMSCHGLALPNGYYILSAWNEKHEFWEVHFQKEGSEDDCDEEESRSAILSTIFIAPITAVINWVISTIQDPPNP